MRQQTILARVGTWRWRTLPVIQPAWHSSYDIYKKLSWGNLFKRKLNVCRHSKVSKKVLIAHEAKRTGHSGKPTLQAIALLSLARFCLTYAWKPHETSNIFIEHAWRVARIESRTCGPYTTAVHRAQFELRVWALRIGQTANVRLKLKISQTEKKWADKNSLKQFLWIKNCAKLLIYV